VSFNVYVDPLFELPSDLPGANPTTNDRMIRYYCLMTKVDGLLGDSTVFFWAGCHTVRDAITCHHPPIPALSRVQSHEVKQHLHNSFKARLSILILSKT
jgi:hypothetical protein